MDRPYPQEIVRLLDSVDTALKRLRQEVKLTRQLLRQIERQTDGSAAAPVGASYVRPR